MNAKRRLSIGFVVPKYYTVLPQGGLVSLVMLVNSLTRKNVECTILAFDGQCFEKKHNLVPEKERIIQGRNSSNKALDFFLKIKEINEFSKDKDLLHFFNMDLNIIAGVFSFISAKKTIVQLNCFDYFYPLKISPLEPKEPVFFRKKTIALQNKIRNAIIKHCSSFICLSKTSKRVYEKLGFDTKKTSVIPACFTTAFLNNKKEFVGKRILYVGALHEEKGVDYLIMAMALVKDKQAKLWIAGDGSPSRKEELKQLVKTLGLEKRVKFLGWVNYSDLPKVFFKSSLFVYPGIWTETFGRTIIEAMLAGLPVIATRIGALVELIRQKQLLCEPKDPLELAKRIDFVLSHKRFAEKTIAKNRAFALGAFSEEKITKRLVKTYFKVLGE